MPTKGELRTAVIHDKNLSETLDNSSQQTINTTNPYYKFAQSQLQMTANNISQKKTADEIKFNPIPPSTPRTKSPTPKNRRVKGSSRTHKRRYSKKNKKSNRNKK